MAPRIAILPDTVADQIAAGEVVERPASVVKELVENSLDAGASRVRVAIEQGGKVLVEVSDDGTGMGREDALLALDRHATSKIRRLDDLVELRSFGFRGEALPAIASVSRFTLSTAEGGGEGTEVTVTGGRVDRVHTVARQRGTTVTVRALFFNVPARRKFLRSVASETRAAHETVATLALAHPEVGFEFHADGQCRLQVPAGQSPDERLASLWGADLAAEFVPVHYTGGGVGISGWAQRPDAAQPTGRRVQLFVNGRPFRDPFLVRAAEAGYRSAIRPGDRPSLLLRIDVRPADMDVNVHPAKLEVRFRDRIGLERAAEAAVRAALGSLAAAVPMGEDGAAGWGIPALAGPVTSRQPAGHALPQDLFDAISPSGGAEEPAAAPVPATPPAVVQLFRTYLAYEAPDGLVIVDQHSAHERVLYEEVILRLRSGAVPSQRTLVPETLPLSREEHDAWEASRDELARLGFELEPFGGRSVVLHAAPQPHPRFDAVRCLRELLADLAGGRFGGLASRLERFAMTYACRAAVKAGDALAPAEMQELLARLFRTELPPHDVHGRATIVRLPLAELERRFGRR